MEGQKATKEQGKEIFSSRKASMKNQKLHPNVEKTIPKKIEEKSLRKLKTKMYCYSFLQHSRNRKLVKCPVNLVHDLGMQDILRS